MSDYFQKKSTMIYITSELKTYKKEKIKIYKSYIKS